VTSLDGEAFSQQLGQLDNLALILADYHLDHDRTGIQVIKKLRQQANWDIPSVIITADQTDKIKKEVQENNAFLLNKPIKPLSLRTLLNRLMKR